jgi:hypothetical protein
MSADVSHTFVKKRCFMHNGRQGKGMCGMLAGGQKSTTVAAMVGVGLWTAAGVHQHMVVMLLFADLMHA